ncbi:hypothetical protein [Phaeovulum sp.]|uniref:hypothetical protein n=1 Tax=Phaeovulum sp. TaxID=2934796 RepID=UPI00272F4189|nr:hypothetical protein [Phaeovulum sp.]MDP1669638.1 hypothetical protein [Phaeovulum sp.]MDZ4117830.1 hypothetical protein [Phaeovulum sp.]
MLELRDNGKLVQMVAEGGWVTLPNGDRLSPALAGWSNGDGLSLVAAPEPTTEGGALPLPEPTAEERRGALPALSRRQVFIGLVASGLATAQEVLAISASGTVPAVIEAAFAATPEPQQSYARITFAEFTVAQRLDPTTLLLQAAGGLSDAELDAFFVEFAKV